MERWERVHLAVTPTDTKNVKNALLQFRYVSVPVQATNCSTVHSSASLHTQHISTLLHTHTQHTSNSLHTQHTSISLNTHQPHCTHTAHINLTAHSAHIKLNAHTAHINLTAHPCCEHIKFPHDYTATPVSSLGRTQCGCLEAGCRGEHWIMTANRLHMCTLNEMVLHGEWGAGRVGHETCRHNFSTGTSHTRRWSDIGHLKPSDNYMYH